MVINRRWNEVQDVEQVAEKYRAICEEKAGDNYTAIIIEME